jgi:predicted deacylase
LLKKEHQYSSMINSTVDFEKNGSQFGTLRIPHSVHRSAYGHIAVPIAVFKNGAGPTVLLTGGVHGGEYEGPIALAKLGQRLRAEDVTGRIIIVPALNYPAFLAASRVSPIDGVNLNRTFPGKRDGTVTEMIAHYVTSTLLPMSDYLFDFHAGGSSLQYLPCVLAPSPTLGSEADAVSRLVFAFAPARVLQYDSERALSGEDRVIGNYAKKNGVTFLCGEFGGGASVNLDGLRDVESGVVRLLLETKVLRPELPLQLATLAAGQRSTRDTEYFAMDDPGLFAFATKPGFFEPAFRLGNSLEPNAVAGYIYDSINPWAQPETVHFRSKGVAVCIRTFAQVEAGDCLGHLGRPLASNYC